jgi:hypothetical protein
MTDDELLNPFEETAPNPFAADEVLNPFANDTDLLNPFTATEPAPDGLLNPFAQPGPDDVLNPFAQPGPDDVPFINDETHNSAFDDPGEHQLIDL